MTRTDKTGEALTRRIHRSLSALPLSLREKQVLGLLLQGHSNKEIASACRLQEQTVKDHLKHIYAKLGMHGRSAVFVWFLRQSLLRHEKTESLLKGDAQLD